MTKILKIQFLLLVIGIVLFDSCVTSPCDKPAGDQRTIEIPVRMPFNSTAGSCDFFPERLLQDFKQKGNNALTSTFKSKKDEWIIEAKVTGDCWTEDFIFADAPTSGTTVKGTVSTRIVDNAERMLLQFPNLPTRNGKLTFQVDIYSPCTGCATSIFPTLRTQYSFSVQAEFTGLTQSYELPMRDAKVVGNVIKVCN